jgi:hypothetical protein
MYSRVYLNFQNRVLDQAIAEVVGIIGDPAPVFAGALFLRPRGFTRSSSLTRRKRMRLTMRPWSRSRRKAHPPECVMAVGVGRRAGQGSRAE